MSTLLEQASLVLIPSGIKASKVYCEIPEDGSGDMTFSRASTGTRINSQGLVEVVPYNLAEYSNTFSNGVWTTGGYGNLPTLTANSIANPVNGLTDAWTASFSSSGTQGRLMQLFTGLTVGLPYTYSMYVKAGTKTSVSIYSDAQLIGLSATFNLSNGTITSTTSGVTATITALSNGWYFLTITNNILSNGNGQYGIITNTGDDGTLYIYGAQLNQGAVAKPYYATTDRLNIPRLNYQNGGGGCPSLLLEAQRTNYALLSEDFSNTTYWNAYGSMTVTANQATSPDGYQNADLFYDSGARYNFLTSPVGVYYSISCYFKRIDATQVQITCSDGVTGDMYSNFNLVNLTSSSSTSGDWTNTSTQIISIGNGWYRCVLTGLRGSAGSVIGYRIECSESEKSFYAWGYQAEVGSYPSSYIPTLGTSVTRVADTMYGNLPNSNMTFTAYLECVEAPVANAIGDWFYIYDSSSILGRAFGWANTFGFADAYSLGVTNSAKMVWKQESGSTAKVFKNGALAGTSTSGTYSNPFNRLSINGTYLDKPLNIKEFVFFDNALTDAQCIELTS